MEILTLLHSIEHSAAGKMGYIHLQLGLMFSGLIHKFRRESARFFSLLIEPKSSDINVRRREFFLNILLLSLIAITFFASLVAGIDYGISGYSYLRSSVIILSIILVILCFIYVAARRGYVRVASFFFIAFFTIPIIYTLIIWGMYLPEPLLMYGLIIIMSSILLGTRVSFVVTAFLSVVLIVITYLQIQRVIPVDLEWIHGLDPKVQDAIMFSAGLFVITIVSWLSNREIEKSLKRAIASEKALQKERDLLEQKVEERTRELKQAQLEKMFHIYRFVEFGRMASGFFHDLSLPLTTLSLNVESLHNKFPSEEVDRAQLATVKMIQFIHAMRKQLQKHEIKSLFHLEDEITDVFHIVSSKARDVHVELIRNTEPIKSFGNPLRFNQLVTNLLTNAVDAYEGIERKHNRTVIVTLKKQKTDVVLTVQDFGCGIAKEHLKLIFDPFFTTKKVNAGTGLGLPICRTIVEEEFHGKITVESTKGEGSTVQVRIPVTKK